MERANESSSTRSVHAGIGSRGWPLATLVTALAVIGLSPLAAQRTWDSAGVRMVMNRSIATVGTAFALDQAAAIDFGGLHDDERKELSPLAIGDLYRLPTGEIAVLDRYAIKFFLPNGKFIRSFGRKGGGPGEFQSAVRELCISPDGRLLAMESTAPRFSLFEGYKTFRSTIAFQGFSVYLGCLGGGKFLARTVQEVGLGSGTQGVKHVVIDRAGKQVGVVGVLPVTDYNSLVPRVVSIAGFNDNLYVGDGSSYEYKIYDLEGRLIRVVRTPDHPTPFSSSDAEVVVESRIPDRAPAAARDELRGNLNSLPRPSTWPVYTRLMVDPLGRVWLGDSRKKSGEIVAWTVFDSIGVLIGRVHPADSRLARQNERFNVVRWTEREAIVSFLDGDGAPHVAAIPFRPSVRTRP